MDRETLQALASFREELEDRLERLRPLVEDLDVVPAARDREAVHEIFRQLHSLKGAAYLLDLRPIGQLSHALEDTLALIRNGELDFDESIRELLLSGLDRIEDLGQDLRKVRLMDMGRELAAIESLLKAKTRVPYRPRR